MKAMSVLKHLYLALAVQFGLTATEAIEARAFLSETGHWPEQRRATPYDVALHGNYAYVTTDAGLKVIDLTEPTNPREIDTINVPGGSLTVSGNHLYIGGSSLQILDLSEPGRPRAVASVPVLVWSREVEISGGYAFIAGGWHDPGNNLRGAHGLQIVDITDPANPIRVGRYTNPPEGASWAESVAVSGNHAYLAAGHDGLYVLEVSQPTTPRRVGRFHNGKFVQRVAAAKGLAYVSDGLEVLDVVDATAPDNPRRVGGYTASGGIRKVQVAGDRMYLTIEAIGLEIVDISDPARLRQIAIYKSSLGYNPGVDLADGRAAVADGVRGFQYVDLVDPADPSLLGGLEMGGSSQGVAVLGKHVFVADGGFLQVLDATEAAKPRRVGRIETAGTTQSIAIAGQYAVVAEMSPAGVEIFDVSNPVEPKRLGRCDAKVQWNAQIALSGHHAFVTAGNSGSAGVQVIDFSDPVNPRVAATHRTVGTALDVAIFGKYLIVAAARLHINDTGAVEILDISTPADPKRVKVLNSGGEGLGVAVAGNFAYVAGRWVEPDVEEGNGLHVIDISDPPNAKRIAGSGMRGDYWYAPADVAVNGNFALVSHFLGSSSGRVQLFAISDPAAPRRLGSVDIDNALSLAVEGDGVYVAAGWEGLKVMTLDEYLPRAKITERSSWPPRPSGSAEAGQIRGRIAYLTGIDGLRVVDLGNPEQAVEVGSLSIPGGANSVEISGDLAFVSSKWRGWRVVDISNPIEPRLLAFHDPERPVSGLSVSGNLLYITHHENGTGTGGFQIVDITDPMTPRLLGRYSKRVQSLKVRNQLAYLVTGPEFEVIDVSDPARPIKLSGYAFESSQGYHATLAGNFAYVATSRGLEILHIGDPLNPKRAGGIPGDTMDSVAVAGSVAYAVAGDRVETIDVSDPSNPVQFFQQWVPHPGRITIAENFAYTFGFYGISMIDLSHLSPPRAVYSTPNETRRSALEESIVYSVGRDFRITDFANAEAPEELSRLGEGAFPDEARLEDVAVSEGCAYVTGPGLFVIDVADRRNPRKLARHNPAARYGRIAVHNWNAVTVRFRENEAWLESIDVADSSNPVLAGEYHLGRFNYPGLVRSGNHVYLAGEKGLTIVDVSNPSVPRVIGEYPTPGTVPDVAVSNGYAYLVGGDGMVVIDVRNPSLPVRVGKMREFQRAEFANSIAVAGDYAWLSGYSEIRDGWVNIPGGVQLVDLSNPREPRPIADYSLTWRRDLSYANSISAAGNLACLAIGPGGMKMLDLTTLIPKLRVERRSGRLQLSWERTEVPFQLQHKGTAHGPEQWRNLNTPLQPAAERIVHEAPLSGGNEFFRLVQ
jgi:hypothetical protein